MALMPVAEARARLLALVRDTAPEEQVPLARAANRVLARDVPALRTQPPFPASAMDGYAVRHRDLALDRPLRLIGEAAAGVPFNGPVGTDETVRIFTGAPVPEGADTVLMQENVAASGQGLVTPTVIEPQGRHIRAAGLDFAEGRTLLATGTRLDARKIGLAAAGGHPTLPVASMPLIGILSTGDELVLPGEPTGPGQIVASNSFTVAALVEQAGAQALDLGIARDNRADLDAKISAALAAKCRVLVTLGGASVGDHDLVQPVLKARGMALDFWKIAMRPGKPMMLGELDGMIVLGLPGNPVSTFVCSVLFLEPLIRRLMGASGPLEPTLEAGHLGSDLPTNDLREDYMRSRLVEGPDGTITVMPASRQDSSMMQVLAQCDALLLREAHAPAAKAGDACRFIRL